MNVPLDARPGRLSGVDPSPIRARPLRACLRTLLLAGASAAALIAAAPPVAARDILSGAGAPSAAAVSAARAAAAQAAQAATRRAQDSLSRATQAIQATRAAQQAARAAALTIPRTVPDGLGPGGLQPVLRPNSTSDGLTQWTGAGLPTQAAGTNKVTIRQTEGRAVLSWESFNVGAGTVLTFDQRGHQDWIALNRVVGQLDPVTGRRDPSQAPKPSQILGGIKADGTVLVINQNGVLFGPGAQVDVHSLMVSALEVGRAVEGQQLRGIAQRNQEFLASGLLGFNDTSALPGSTFSAQRVIVDADAPPQNEALAEGTVEVAAGARIVAGKDGLILLTGPRVVNRGTLTADDGQVMLQSGRDIQLRRSEGAATSLDPKLRGVVATSLNSTGDPDDYALNSGLIEARRGNITLGGFSAALNQGVLSATTSVSRNGSLVVSAADIKLAPGSVLAIAPDDGTEVIPQDAESIAAFKPSSIVLGNRNNLGSIGFDQSARIAIARDTLIRAPGATVEIGTRPGAAAASDQQAQGRSRVFIDQGATIDVAGLTDVAIPASRNVLQIGPLKGNELANSPLFRNSFLNGATVYVDPRLSGVRADGVAWIGSPLLDAASYYAQVGVGVAELMIRGGTVTLGAQSFAGIGQARLAPDVTVKAGATIDVSGGWVRYGAGTVRTTQLLTGDGQVVDIGKADPNIAYAGFAGGIALGAGRVVSDYTEGADAGALTIKASAVAFDGTLHADAHSGRLQLLNGAIGSAASGVFGDSRRLQAARDQRPAGGFLFIQAMTPGFGGADVAIVHGTVAAQPDTLGRAASVTVGADGALLRDAPGAGTRLPANRRETLVLADSLLSDGGLAQVSVHSSGRLTVAADAAVTLQPGGVFDAVAGRSLTVAGRITVPSGKIALETFNSRGLSDHRFGGSVFADKDLADRLGDYDLAVTGTLSTRGLWVNDLGALESGGDGGAWLGGGTISLYAAPNIAAAFDRNGRRLIIDNYTGLLDPDDPAAPRVAEDLSGSILVASQARLDLSGGGRVRPDGSFDLSGKGGSLSLASETTYGQLSRSSEGRAGGLGTFRVGGLFYENNGTRVDYVPLNPTRIEARVAVAPGSILAHGFAGGGSFTLTTPELALGTATPGHATALPLDFFAQAGFASYQLTSYHTALIGDPFTSGYGGSAALLATQTLTVGAGQTLALSQSMLPGLPELDQGALRGLASGGDLLSVVTPAIPTEAWDRKAVDLTLGGLLELHVAAGGRIEGAAGAHLTVPKLFNQGTIRLPGGTITQSEVLPLIYGADGLRHGVHDLAEAFAAGPDGRFDEAAANRLGIRDDDGVLLTNGQLAGSHALYLLGLLDEGEGVRLAPGSVTDLSGTVLINPRATITADGTMIRDGRVVGGGALEATPSHLLPGLPFRANGGLLGELSLEGGQRYGLLRAARQVTLEAGARLDLSGVAARFDLPAPQGVARPFASGPVWSDGGRLSAPNGLLMTGAVVRAEGGAAMAQGGRLELSDLTLVEHDGAPLVDRVAADQIEQAGFDTLLVFGSLTGSGKASLTLGRAFVLENRPYAFDPRFNIADGAVRDGYLPTLRSRGGALTIDAPYVRLGSDLFDTVSDPGPGRPGGGAIAFQAAALDLVGALRLDRSVGEARFEATGDLRLIGARPWQALLPSTTAAPATLKGQIAGNGNLSFAARRIYPTTASSVTISSTAADGLISFARQGGSTPPGPLSAGADLAVQARHIVQGGVLQVPLGSLTLGGTAPLHLRAAPGEPARLFAPATASLVLDPGSITSVSAGGLTIPYGTTTDGTEWFFTPTSAEPLTKPPAGLLHLAGADIVTAAGATIDLAGGGDVFAYEFVPGTGGSLDLLSRTNSDPSTATAGLQYPDGRQIYAIVPGLSDAPVAAFDPIYAADYGRAGDIGSVGGAGRRVWLDAAPGLAAGWYTLLPARYALLPGAMRVVERSAGGARPDSAAVNPDGSLVVSGHYGDALSGAASSTTQLFDVMPRDTVLAHSKLQLTQGNGYFATLAGHDGRAVPRLALDAGRLVLEAASRLVVEATVRAAAATGGRGAQVDLAATAIELRSSLSGTAPADGTVRLTAASLNNLQAESLVIGAVRSDRDDGTTGLDVVARHITIANDAAHPLDAPEIVLAVDDQAAAPTRASISVADGAAITATGMLTDGRTGDYVIDARGTSTMTGAGAVLRVANGPERLVARLTDTGAPAVPAARLTVAGAGLAGRAVLLDSTGELKLAGDAAIAARFVALGAGQVTFADAAAGLGGLVVTPDLRTRFAAAERFTLRATEGIAFEAGTYRLGATRLDTPGLIARQNGTVVLQATSLDLSNRTGATLGPCAVACGSGRLAVQTGALTIGPGSLRSIGFDGGVTLAADTGLFGSGTGRFDAAAADLRIVTPFIGDRAGGGPEQVATSLATLGAVTITAPAGAPPLPAGRPGTALAIDGRAIAITGTRLRASAGSLTLRAAEGITLAGGATLSAPGFDQSFGDAADAIVEAAAGGRIAVTAVAGAIDLGAGTLVSVGGGAGRAGSLSLSGASLRFGGTLDGHGRLGGGALSLDSDGALDLGAVGVAANAQGFTGTLDLRSQAGDLILGAGQRLQAEAVTLAAEGGRLAIAGTIDVAGVRGGDVALYGAGGVTLEAGARIDASAAGYGPEDGRQAQGGTVVLGTAGSGALHIARGAVIDVAARHPGDRLIRVVRNGAVHYERIAGDQGGVVGLGAPVVERRGPDSVNVTVADADAIRGARAVTLDGIKRWDLAALAAAGRFAGVALDAARRTITLDVAAELDTADSAGTLNAVGRANLLGDNAPGTVVDFVQNFDLSGAYGALGGLAGRAEFQARPVVDLAYEGNITLASNWNLGAGVVDQEGAVAAGVMIDQGGSTAVVAGREADLLRRFTRMTYRTGGSVLGAAPLVRLRAGGDLALQGSLTDGFFQFSDPDRVSGGGTGLATVGLDFGDFAYFDYSAGTVLSHDFTLVGLGAGGGAGYNPAGNSPAALTAGDALASAVLFPLVCQDGACATRRPVDSAAFGLVAGAPVGRQSGRLETAVDPLATRRGASGALTIRAENSRVVTVGGAPRLAFPTRLDDGLYDGDWVTADQLAAALGADYVMAFDFSFYESSAGAAALAAFQEVLADGSDPVLNDLVDRHGEPSFDEGYIEGAAAVVAYYISRYGEAATIADINGDFVAAGEPPPLGGGGTKTVTTRTVIRTGSGSIDLAAAGDVDLYDPSRALPRYDADGVSYDGGAAAVYTVGHAASSVTAHLADPETGAAVRVVAPRLRPTVPGSYYLSGGGDVRVAAGGSVNSARAGGPRAVQDYLVGTVGGATDLTVRPGAFTEGIGALGGGDVAVSAGRDVVDLSVVAAGSAAGAASNAATGDVLLRFGDGDVTVAAGGRLAGGRIDVWSGRADVVAGDIVTAGTVAAADPRGAIVALDNSLTLRLFDATVAVASRGGLALQGLAAFAAAGPDATGNYAQGAVDRYGFYGDRARVDLVANGSIGFANSAATVLVGDLQQAAAFNTVWPAGVTVASLLGDLDLGGGAAATLLMPGARGDLKLLAGGTIGAATVAMLDADPGQLPGLFSAFSLSGAELATGLAFRFPAVFSTTSDSQRAQQHNGAVTHEGDPEPVRIQAGGDIGGPEGGLILSLPKQARIGAGRDIVNMVLFGQNVASGDVTRVAAGRDITATTRLLAPALGLIGNEVVPGDLRPALLGNLFVLGGPGRLVVEAGRDLGPFLNAAIADAIRDIGNARRGIAQETYPGGILSVGNEWNPALPETGAAIDILFGVAKGVDFAGLRDYYLDPANLAALPDDLFEQVPATGGATTADRTKPIYGPLLVRWMTENAADALEAAYGRTAVSYADAYAVFKSLPLLRQRIFLTTLYFNELKQAAVPESPSFGQYSRGYQAVNRLFPAGLGYTLNDLTGGSNGANALVETGALDLRLATIQSARGGDITILGPGGRVLAGSTVRTSDQAARRAYDGGRLFAGNADGGHFLGPFPAAISAIPTGYEGVLTLRGGAIASFTDGDFLLNQSRLYTRQGGDITLWSSNGDLNAGQGPKTTANLPPVVIKIDQNLFAEEDRAGSTSGAGIAAYPPLDPKVPQPDVVLIAPRGTVDAGDAGVRVAGSLFVAALHVANAQNFQVSGASVGTPAAPATNVGGLAAASSATGASAAAAAEAARGREGSGGDLPSIITVEVTGYGGPGQDCDDPSAPRDKCR